MLNLSFINGMVYIPKSANQAIGPVEVRPTPSGQFSPYRLEFLTPVHAIRSELPNFGPDTSGNYLWSSSNLDFYVHVDINMNGVATFYAFLTYEEREFFRTCIEVPGIGGKTALQVLAKNAFADIQRLIQAGDKKAFIKLPGLGPKKGLAIADHVFVDAPEQPKGESPRVVDQNVVMALQTLGLKAKDARDLVVRAMEAFPNGGTINESELLTAALKLGQRK